MNAPAAPTNHQVRLARRPVGLPTRADWSFTAEPVEALSPGGVLVKTLSLSLDPAMRGWMNEARSYIPPVAIDEVMRAGGIGSVVATESPPSPSATASAARSACRSTPPSRTSSLPAASSRRSTRAWAR